ncbi:M3 family metallopeptidase [Ferrimonas marina]|uniref:Peptidyl-dipeptidase Dcp n=1 Tax=Ferrimonas marina TaxID=299255 RepID=A0A1M5X5R6_9GAMM|nr:M3 family metallopeptidase [Ferrimonas marina]SHH94543.1 peptidyl-dipeptidase Dcp [Ferrimonas marina]
MLPKSLIAATVALTLAACSSTVNHQETTALSPDNPFAAPSSLIYQAPDFTQIEDSHFKPAFEAGMAQHLAEIELIANNPDPATFDNTIVAMEKSGALLTRTASVFYNLASSTGNDERTALMAEFSPKMSEHSDNIYLNDALFQRVDGLYQQRAELGLDSESLRLLEVMHQRFELAGAKLTDEQKVKVRELNKRLSTLSTTYGQNLLKASQEGAVRVKDKARLKGLSEGRIQAAAAAANKAGYEGEYLITLTNTTRQSALIDLEDRALREQVWKASAYRATEGEFDNRGLVLEQAQLRAQKAALFGFNSWAEYKLQTQMAKKPEAVLELLGSMAPKVVANAGKEADEIRALMKAEGADFELQPWDWFYYGEKVRAQKYNLDQDEVSQYLEFNRVLEDGVFYTMTRQFGITFKARPDIPAYHEDVKVYEIFDKDSSSMGLFYADYFARQGKRGGAWMNVFVGQSHLLENKPVIVNVMNIRKAAKGQPQLVSFDEATTMFHEMGHGVHGLFSDVTYPSLAGTAVSTDFVEFPSTYMEDWAFHPEVINNYAKHYETGETIPPALLEKVLAAAKFNQGFDTLEYLAAALLDMEWHSIDANTQIDDVAEFEAAALARNGVALNYIPPRYKSTYFAHTFAGGYSAGYYAYMWSEILAADAFAHVREQGGLTEEQGEWFRKTILSVGNSQDLMEAYKGFKGAEPTTEALLIRRGINL